MRRATSLLGIALFLFALTSQAQVKTQTVLQNFETLVGSWQGSLTYLDYSSGKPYTMPANLEIKRLPNTDKFIFTNIYPNEKSANSADTVTVANDGKMVDRVPVTSVKHLPDGTIQFITEEQGTDGNDNKPALIRHTYTIGLRTYSKRKDVQFTGTQTWIKRHEYAYIRTQ